MGDEPAPLRAIVAKRLSRLTDATTHLATESETIEEYCRRKNIVVVAETEDLDVSGGKPIRERPRVGPWLTLDHIHEWDLLVLYKLDRGFRNHLDFTNFYHEFCEVHGKKIVSVSEDIDMSTQMGRFIAGILVQFAEWELQRMRQRRGDAAKVLREEARWGGGPFPFGYIPYKEGAFWYLKPHPVYAKEVVWMAESVVAGKPPGSVAWSLTQRGIPTARDVQNEFFGKPVKKYAWTTTQVKHILRSDLTRGYVVHHANGPQKPPIRVIDPATGEFIRRAPLIDDDLWVKLQAALDASTKKLSGVRAKGSVLLGIGFCGYCGAPLYRAGAKDRKGWEYAYYLCKYAKSTCKPSRSIDKDTLENAVFGNLLSEVGDCQLTEKRVIAGDDHSAILMKIGHQITDLTSQNFTSGGVPDYHAKMAVLQAEYERISVMPKEPPVIRMVSTGKAFRSWWKSADDDQRHAYLKDANVTVRVVRAEHADKIMLSGRTTETAENPALDIPLSIVMEAGKFIVHIDLGTLGEQLQRASSTVVVP